MNNLTRNICRKHQILFTKWPDFMQIATFMKLKIPPPVEEVEFPAERKKLRPFEKVPFQLKVEKLTRDIELMRGPELVHNRLIYGKFGIQALSGGRLRHAHYEMIRLTVNKNLNEKTTFATWRVGPVWQPITKKGTATRMGGGKGNVDYYAFPIKAGRIIFEIGGTCEYQEIEKKLRILCPKMPFKARIVTEETFKEDEKLENFIQENNVNPFSFEHCANNNFDGLKIKLSPFHIMYKGKYR